MKRLWIRAHAVKNVKALARQHGATVLESASRSDPQDMVVVKISDHLAPFVMADGYLIACGKVLAKGEKPPYLGSDPGTGGWEEE